MSAIQISPKFQIPSSELNFSYSRSRGPGGQNVNKVNTKATLRWAFLASEAIDDYVKQRILTRWRGRINKLNELVIHSEESREQAKNSQNCLKKLGDILQDAAKKEKRRLKTKPSRSAIKKRLENKKIQSEKKQSRKSIPFDS